MTSKDQGNTTPIYPFGVYRRVTPLETVYGVIVGVSVYKDGGVSGRFYSGGGHSGLVVSEDGRYGHSINDYELLWTPFKWNKAEKIFELTDALEALPAMMATFATLEAQRERMIQARAAKAAKPATA